MAVQTRTSSAATRTRQRHRVLVVAEEACAAPDLCSAIQLHAGGREVDALIVAPAHDPAGQWIVTDGAVASDAEERLDECVACLRTAGIEGRAQVADPDPIEAIADALHAFPADEIVIFTRHLGSGWLLHRNLIDRARRRFPQPIEHVVVGD